MLITSKAHTMYNSCRTTISVLMNYLGIVKSGGHGRLESAHSLNYPILQVVGMILFGKNSSGGGARD